MMNRRQFTGVKAILFARAVPIPLDARILAIYSRMSAASSPVSRFQVIAHRIDASAYSRAGTVAVPRLDAVNASSMQGRSERDYFTIRDENQK
jgi:hypothetical protein